MRKIAVLLLLLSLAACGDNAEQTQPDVSAWLGGGDTSGFIRADKAREFEFPADHGKHEGFRNEWWYLTGNLFDPDGHRFAYQLTFFRVGMGPQEQNRESAWAAEHIWMAHLAVSDVDNKKHIQSQRFAREAAGLAGARMEPFSVWLEDWSLTSASGNTLPWKLSAATEEFSLYLDLSSEKQPVLQGENGLSRKGAELGNASYYYSMTRINTSGQLALNGKTHTVTGLSWLDREWSTSVLSESQVGWDWFSLQFSDGRDLMYYQIRKSNDDADESSAGSLVDTKGLSRHLEKQDVELNVIKHWTSESGRTYPVEWQMKVSGEPLTWIIRAAFEQQEMQTAVIYWEGAVDIVSEQTGKKLGTGFLEMTGY